MMTCAPCIAALGCLGGDTDLIFCDSVPVTHYHLQLDIIQASFFTGQIKDEGLIEDRVEAPFLDMCLLLHRTNVLVIQVDFHVGI